VVTLKPGTIIWTVSSIQDILSVAQDNNLNRPYDSPPQRHPNRRYAADRPYSFQLDNQRNNINNKRKLSI